MIKPGWTGRQWRFALLVAVDVAVLGLFAPNWPVLGRHLASADDWISQVGADHAAATLASAALWLLAIWVAIALAVVLLARAPGGLGAAGRAIADRLLPGALLRLIAGATGLSILALPTVAAAASAPSAGGTPGPGWPLSPSASVSTSTGAPMPSPLWPTSQWQLASVGWPATATPGHPSAVARAAQAAPLTAPAAHRAAGPTTITTAATESVVVAPGDCLWRLAAARLDHPSPAQVEREVQRWYAANRAVIGPDPSLLHPGQVLVEPRVPTPSIHGGTR